jgi:hypothetical protein
MAFSALLRAAFGIVVPFYFIRLSRAEPWAKSHAAPAALVFR